MDVWRRVGVAGRQFGWYRRGKSFVPKQKLFGIQGLFLHPFSQTHLNEKGSI